mgnify:CR=1 FL=1
MLTKAAIHRMEQVLSEKIGDRLRRWDKKNPKPASDLSMPDRLAIALKDPKYGAALLRRAKARDGYNDLRIDSSNLREDSACVQDACQRVEAANKAHADLRASYADHWQGAKDDMLNRAIIGDMSAADALEAVNKF